MTNGLAFDTSHIALPIAPDHIFVAANSDKEVSALKQLAESGEMAKVLNDRMPRQARKYVYSTDDRQLRFIENRLGEKAAWSPIE